MLAPITRTCLCGIIEYTRKREKKISSRPHENILARQRHIYKSSVMKLLLPRPLAENDLRLRLLAAGQGDALQAGWVHEKTEPCAIIAEATRGHYTLECREASWHIDRGEAWVTAPDQPLRITHHADARTGAPTAFRFVHFSFMMEYGFDVTRLLRLPMKLNRRQYAPICAIIRELLQKDTPGKTPELGWQVRRTELAYTLLRLLCEAAAPSPDAHRLLTQTHRLGPLIEHLHANLSAAITAADMAKACGLSLSGFHRFFRQHAATSPLNYLKQMRLNEAAHQMLSTDYTLDAIATHTGFANAFHFSREFKKKFGCPPSVYRTGPYRNQIS